MINKILSVSILSFSASAQPHSGFCRFVPGWQQGRYACECIAPDAETDPTNRNRCTCGMTYVPGSDRSFTLKLSGDFKTCGILKKEKDDRVKELRTIARHDIKQVQKSYKRHKLLLENSARRAGQTHQKRQRIKKRCASRKRSLML